VGEGKGRPLELEVAGGVVGVIVDGRGRPLEIPTDSATRTQTLTKWNAGLDVYPQQR